MQNDNLNEPNYSTQTSFVNAVRDVFNQYSSGTGTVRSLHAGTGISLSPDNNIITSEGIISLNASLENLNNVKLTTPNDGDVIKWTGTCWEAQPVTGGTSVSFVQLSGVDVQLGSNTVNHLLRINSSGTAVETTPNNYINTFIGNGIAAATIGNNTALLNLDAATLNSQSSNNTGEMEFFINNTLNQSRKIKQNIVELANFRNESSDRFVRFADFANGSDISINTGGGSITISFDGTLTAGIDLSRAHGVLSLHSGGTSAITITGAQENLKLVPNKDILARDGPSFRDRLFGDNIILRPYKFTISTISTGSSYFSGPAHLLDPRSAGNFFRVEIGSSISPGGGVSIGNLIGRDGTCIRTGNDGNYILENYEGHYFTPPSIFSLTHSSGGGSGASFRITPHDQYINFGPSEGEHGFGLRNRHGYIQVRNSELTPDGASWLNLYPQNLSILSDVNITSPTGGQVLLYNGTCFINTTLDVGITVATDGTVGVCIGRNSIYQLLGLSTITTGEVLTLQNVRSNIQEQIDSKVGTSGVSPTPGSLIYYNGGSSIWQSIPLPGIAPDEAEILGHRITSAGLSEPSYGSFYDFFGLSETDIDKNDTRLPVYTYGISRCRLYPLENIFRPIINTGTRDNGLQYDSISNTLHTTNDYLIPVSDPLEPGDIFSVYTESPNSGERNKGLSYRGLLENIVGEGLCAPAGGTSIVLGSRDFFQLNPRTFGTSPQPPLVSAGAIAFFSDTNKLGVYLGTCWHGISIGPPISS
jgi:hypothetical protein